MLIASGRSYKGVTQSGSPVECWWHSADRISAFRSIAGTPSARLHNQVLAQTYRQPTIRRDGPSEGFDVAVKFDPLSGRSGGESAIAVRASALSHEMPGPDCRPWQRKPRNRSVGGTLPA
jgi:hypothetical protein